MALLHAPVPKDGFLVTHFLTVADQARSREFYVDILGGEVVAPENPCIIRLANSWIVVNSGGGPTPDKPEITLETPQERNRVSSFLNLRVADIQASYSEWKAKGAEFLTEPLDNHGVGLEMLHARSRRLLDRGWTIEPKDGRAVEGVFEGVTRRPAA